jgi:hypothetical protein
MKAHDMLTQSESIWLRKLADGRPFTVARAFLLLEPDIESLAAKGLVFVRHLPPSGAFPYSPGDVRIMATDPGQLLGFLLDRD